MNIENQIPLDERLKYGIFFTQPHIVSQITNKFNFEQINTIIDSAAGSCNFLIPLAKLHPQKRFYGIEKNKKVFEDTLKKIKQHKNIKYFHGDALFDNFSIPPCDLYIGNPPFINFSDLDEKYKRKIKPLWLKYFKINKGFRMLLGESRGDLSQLIFYFTIQNFLKDNGKIGIVLPNSLIKGNEASASFREFTNIKVKEIIDISNQKAFANTNRNSFYIIAKKGHITSYPIPYLVNKTTHELVKIGSDLVKNPNEIWLPSPYTSRQGINTLGANSIFFFKNEVPFSSGRMYPLFKSSDINKWQANASYKVLLPYENKKILEESQLKQNYPKAYNYLLSHKKALQNRKSKFVKQQWYTLFGIGDYTFANYKVIWRALGAKQLTAAVVQQGIPNQSMHCYTACENEQEAHYICAIMNSTIYTKKLLDLNEAGAKSFAQPSTIKKIYIPKFNAKINSHNILANLSLELHSHFTSRKEKQLDQFVTKFYVELKPPTSEKPKQQNLFDEITK